jgi:transcriptional regulator with XRE-family HTH domain
MSPDHSFPSSCGAAAALDGRIALDAALLKTLRKTRGLSQEALAELCANQQLAVSIASIKRAETGKVVLYRTARHLATIFELDVDALVLQAAAPGAAAAPPCPAPEPAVRYVIELHIELAGPPAADGEALRAIAGVAHQFGGHARAADGARAVAVFGLPQAYLSDAERAMRCALELGRLLAPHGARAMALRLARWDDGEAGPAGQALPDLRAAAGGDPGLPPAPAPLYVGRNLAGQLGGRFAFDGAPPRFAGYLQSAGIADGDNPARTALAGRASEMRQFRAVTEAALEAQGGHIVYLRAMAGVGKTRLSIEFAAIARQAGFGCHRCEVLDAGAASWRTPLGQLARSLLGMASDDSGAQATLDDAMAALQLAPESAIFYRAITGTRMTSAQVSLYAAMSHAVRDAGIACALQLLVMRRAQAGPLLLTVEDVHWGDGYLFEALGALLALTRGAGGVGADLAHRGRPARSIAAGAAVRPAADGVRPGAAGRARGRSAGRPVRRCRAGLPPALRRTGAGQSAVPDPAAGQPGPPPAGQPETRDPGPPRRAGAAAPARAAHGVGDRQPFRPGAAARGARRRPLRTGSGRAQLAGAPHRPGQLRLRA